MGSAKIKKKKKGIARLIEIAGTRKWWLFGSVILAVLSAIMQFVPYYSVFVILEELSGKAVNPEAVDTGMIRHWGFVSLGGVFLYGILFYAANMMSHIAAFSILYELRIAISEKLAKLPMGFFGRKSSGEIKKASGVAIPISRAMPRTRDLS